MPFKGPSSTSIYWRTTYSDSFYWKYKIIFQGDVSKFKLGEQRHQNCSFTFYWHFCPFLVAQLKCQNATRNGRCAQTSRYPMRQRCIKGSGIFPGLQNLFHAFQILFQKNGCQNSVQVLILDDQHKTGEFVIFYYNFLLLNFMSLECAAQEKNRTDSI